MMGRKVLSVFSAPLKTSASNPSTSILISISLPFKESPKKFKKVNVSSRVFTRQVYFSELSSLLLVSRCICAAPVLPIGEYIDRYFPESDGAPKAYENTVVSSTLFSATFLSNTPAVSGFASNAITLLFRNAIGIRVVPTFAPISIKTKFFGSINFVIS